MEFLSYVLPIMWTKDSGEKDKQQTSNTTRSKGRRNGTIALLKERTRVYFWQDTLILWGSTHPCPLQSWTPSHISSIFTSSWKSWLTSLNRSNCPIICFTAHVPRLQSFYHKCRFMGLSDEFLSLILNSCRHHKDSTLPC